ncbi:MAG TPA: recombination protein RecR [Flammeovirgaceae bacterium]|nr:recombination protein RecR [Flammeovirgaceae bacterium]
MNFSSKLVEKAVAEVAKLPGIGKKSALRIVLHLLKQPPTETELLSEALQTLRQQIRHCRVCYNIADEEVCSICSSPRRDRSLICVVEDMRDVMAIENTGQYSGLYHVLGGVISPLDGIGPEDLKLEALLERLQNSTEPVKELILALPATVEGDTTAFYLNKKLQPFDIRLTSIARGVPVGSELEYTDEVTLGRSIMNRVVL